MSFSVLTWAARTRGLKPLNKLVLEQLADFHNEDTGQCNPSAELIADYTGLSAWQVHRIVRELNRDGIIERCATGWRFPAAEKEAQPVPADWWPSDETVGALQDAFPSHHFDIEEFVDDFCRFIERRKLTYRPADLDGAFYRNACQLLARRPAGPVTLRVDDERGAVASVGAFIAGL